MMIAEEAEATAATEKLKTVLPLKALSVNLLKSTVVVIVTSFSSSVNNLNSQAFIIIRTRKPN